MSGAKLVVPAGLTSFRSMVDHGFQLKFDTGELHTDAVVALASLRGANGWLFFSDQLSEPGDESLPKESPPASGGNRKQRSPSTKLRDVLYRLWGQVGAAQDFQQYYENVMFGLIEHYKKQLK